MSGLSHPVCIPWRVNVVSCESSCLATQPNSLSSMNPLSDERSVSQSFQRKDDTQLKTEEDWLIQDTSFQTLAMMLGKQFPNLTKPIIH